MGQKLVSSHSSRARFTREKEQRDAAVRALSASLPLRSLAQGRPGCSDSPLPLLRDGRASHPHPSLDLVLTAIITEPHSHQQNAPLASLSLSNDFPIKKTKPWCDAALCRRWAEQSQVFLMGSADGQPGIRGPFCPCLLQISACAKDTHFYSCISLPASLG